MAAQGQPTGANASTITYPKVARALIERVEWFEKERATIQHFAQASIKARGVPNVDILKHREQIERTRGYLDLLEFDTNMSPELRNKTRIEDVLMLINRPKVYFPDDVKQRAEMLLQRFRDENWGAGAEAEDDNDSGHDDDEQAASPTTATAPAAPVGEPGSDTVTLRLPPTDHPIWGLEGIMHRIAVTQGTNRYKIDPRYRPRPAKVSGDNGLAVGAWFPNQFSALVNGAHGAPVAGISGNVDYGAYSIVMAGAYKDVDEDRGETIWYSGPGSADNENRNEVPRKAGTGHLQRSLTTRNPVRVLRAGKKGSAYAPSVGIRYDGLYVVVRQETSNNSKGGLFIRYLLERLPDQKPLKDVRSDSPTAQQMADFRRIKDPW